jgi:hypothetical protein
VSFFFSGFSVRQIGSPHHSTETSSLYYGLLFHLQLLSTLPHGNAVIFSYKDLAILDKDLHLAKCVHSRAHYRPFGDSIRLWCNPGPTLRSGPRLSHASPTGLQLLLNLMHEALPLSCCSPRPGLKQIAYVRSPKGLNCNSLRVSSWVQPK